MADIDTLNAFLQRTDLSATEQAIKDQLIELDGSVKTNNQERERLVTTLKEKEAEYLRLSGAFDAQLKLILTLAKSGHSDESTVEVAAETAAQ